MSDWPILSLVTFLPIVGSVLILLLRGDSEAVARNARYLALWTSLLTFLLSTALWFGFDRSSADFQFVEQASPWTVPGTPTARYPSVVASGTTLPALSRYMSLRA